MEVVAIAGGSGSGKSSVSYALVDTDPNTFEVLNLDDYQKVGYADDVPVVDGMRNWDHPDAIDWDMLRRDIGLLRAGHEVHLDTWAHRSNPDFATTRLRVPRVVVPKPIIIVEGYLALHGAIRDTYDYSFYLDLDEATRLERRRQARHGNDSLSGNPRYNDTILRPMHWQYVEPTKANADVVVGVADKTVRDIAQLILHQLGIAKQQNG